MIPPNSDRSIRNIPVSNNRRAIPPTITPNQPQEDMYNDEPRLPKPPRSNRILWWGSGVVVACAIAGILLSTVFEGATVVVHARTQTLTLPSSITADFNPASGALGYQVMSVKYSATTTANSSGTAHVANSATGNITVYNAYATQAQPLIKNTRFAAPDGKIYRIHSAITVPGATKKADGSLTPGSVTATVFADAPGAEYNRTDDVQFSLPGFAGQPQATKIYAKSQGALAGGLVGDQPQVSPADMATAQGNLKSQLEAAVRAAATANIPEGFVGVGDSLVISNGPITQAPGEGGRVLLSESASASMVMIPANDLAAALAKQLVTNYAGEAVAFADSKAITLSVGANLSKIGTGPLTLSLSGSPALVWQFDAEAVTQALLGKPKSTFEAILAGFAPAIECNSDKPCNASIRPFWKSSFPSDPKKLQVTVGA